MTRPETCMFDGEGVLHIDDPRIEAMLETLSKRWGVPAADALERALDNAILEASPGEVPI